MRTDPLTLGLAQIDSKLGDVAANLERHLSIIEEAREAGVDLLVFPELSLTGYRLLHLTARVALTDDAPEIRRLAEAAGSMTVIAGIVEAHPSGTLFNTSLAVHSGGVVHRHRKLYLPTYGIFQEGRFFGAGDELEVAELSGVETGILICEDLWHPDTGRRLAADGARLLIVPSSGPGRLGPEPAPASSETWEVLTRATALTNTCWVAYCNRVGWEEGSFYPGGSHVVRPGGDIESRAPFLDETLHVTTIDLGEADRLRWRLPLVREWRPA